MNEIYTTLKDLLQLEFGVQFTKISDTLNHLSQIQHVTALVRPIRFVNADDQLNICNLRTLRLRISFIVRETDTKSTYELTEMLAEFIRRSTTDGDVFNFTKHVSMYDNGFEDVLIKNNLIHSAWVELDYTI